MVVDRGVVDGRAEFLGVVVGGFGAMVDGLVGLCGGGLLVWGSGGRGVHAGVRRVRGGGLELGRVGVVVGGAGWLGRGV